MTFFVSGLLIAAIRKHHILNGKKYNDTLLDYKEIDALAWWGFLSLTLGGYILLTLGLYGFEVNYHPDVAFLIYVNIGMIFVVISTKSFPKTLFMIRQKKSEEIKVGDVSKGLKKIFGEKGHDLGDDAEIYEADYENTDWVISVEDKKKYWLDGKNLSNMWVYGNPKVAIEPIIKLGPWILFLVLPYIELSHISHLKLKGKLSYVKTFFIISIFYFLIGTSWILLFSGMISIIIHSYGFGSLMFKYED